MSRNLAMGIAVLAAALLVGAPLADRLTRGNKTPSAPAAGETTYTLVSIDGQPLPCAPMHQGGRAPEVSGGFFTINDNGTFTGGIQFSNPNVVAMPPSGGKGGQPGTYTREGNTLTMKHPGAGYTTATIDGDTFTMDNEGMLFVYCRTASQTPPATEPKTPAS